MSLPLRLYIRSRSSRTSVSARTPSHLTSCTHSPPVGTWVPLDASIGRMTSFSRVAGQACRDHL